MGQSRPELATVLVAIVGISAEVAPSIRGFSSRD
jgi:hypothetical protein